MGGCEGRGDEEGDVKKRMRRCGVAGRGLNLRYSKRERCDVEKSM
jgi:hypothetical protein